MTTRRDIVFGTAAMTALAGALPTFGQEGNGAGDALMQQLVQRLEEELGDDDAAVTLASHIESIALDWSLPLIAAADIDRIVAYGFGNRPNAASGNTSSSGANQAALPDPGPINELLADTVFAIHQIKPVKIYAQWEIARFLASKYQLSDVVSIDPITEADGTIVYLSTDGVAQVIIALEGDAGAMGNVAVVGHRDHAKRCIETSQARGMAAAAVREVALPVTYDAQSGQPWTRRRDLYLIHDLAAQFSILRANLIANAYPNG